AFASLDIAVVERNAVQRRDFQSHAGWNQRGGGAQQGGVVGASPQAAGETEDRGHAPFPAATRPADQGARSNTSTSASRPDLSTTSGFCSSIAASPPSSRSPLTSSSPRTRFT